MINIRDLAEITGFSITTVSRALNGYPDVSPSTRALIEKTAKEYGYSPNILAQGLAQKSRNTFGFITSNFSSTTLVDNFSFKLFMSSVEKGNEQGYEVVLIHYNSSFHSEKSFRQLINERNLAGAIIQGFDTDAPFCQEALESEIPTVFIDMELENETSTFVMSDIAKATQIGFDFLAEKGYRNCAFVKGSMESFVTQRWLTEVDNYFLNTTRHTQKPEIFAGGYRKEISYDTGKKALRNFPEIDAYFCSSDVMAIGFIEAARELGFSLPKDVAILGFDNIIVAEYMSPGLTTIQQFPDGIGGGAIEQLLSLMAQEETPPLLVDVELVIRETV